MITVRLLPCLVAAVCLACPAALAAGQQRPQNLKLEVTGLPAGATVEVALAAANFNKADNFTASSGGRVDTVFDFANFGKPQPDPRQQVQVYIVDCKDPQRVLRVVFVAQGGEAPRECNEQQRETARGCNCRNAAVVFFPTTTGVRVDFANARVEAMGPATAAQSSGGSAFGWLVDLDLGQASLRNPDQNCREFTQELPGGTCDVDGTVGMWSVDAGVTVARFLMFNVGYLDIGKVKLTAGGSQGSVSFQADGEFGRARGVTLTGGVRVPIGRFVPFVKVGGWRWSAPSSVRLTANVPGQPPFSESSAQEDSNWNPVFFAGAELWFAGPVGISAGFGRVSLKSDASAEDSDVDEAFRTFFVGLKLGRR